MFYTGNGINAVESCEYGDFVLLKTENGYTVTYVQSKEPRGVHLSFMSFREVRVSFYDCNKFWDRLSAYRKDRSNANWLNFRDDYDKFNNCIVLSKVKRSNTFIECEDDTVDVVAIKQKSISELLDSI